jgi:hypothetical protein
MRSENSNHILTSRRNFMRSLCAAIPVFSFDQLVSGLPLSTKFVNGS